jgi:U32 family peptidase
MHALEITVSPTSYQSLQINTDADAFIIGEAAYSLRLPYYFTHQELIEAIALIKHNKQKVYVAVNKIIHEYELEQVEQYLAKISQYEVDGFIFGDLSVYRMAKRLNLTHQLIYNPETYVTNYESVNFYSRKGIKRVSIAKEITLEDIKEIGLHTKMEIEILGHGALNMFHSKRDLVTNYFKFIKYDEPTHFQNQELYLIEEKRQEEKYPILEDQNGTHIFSGSDLCTIDYLDVFIESGMTSIRIDGFLKNDHVLKEIVSVYRQAINDYINNKEKYQSNKQAYLETLKGIEGIRPFNTGFLFKKTVYKG